MVVHEWIKYREKDHDKFLSKKTLSQTTSRKEKIEFNVPEKEGASQPDSLLK